MGLKLSQSKNNRIEAEEFIPPLDSYWSSIEILINFNKRKPNDPNTHSPGYSDENRRIFRKTRTRLTFLGSPTHNGRIATTTDLKIHGLLFGAPKVCPLSNTM